MRQDQHDGGTSYISFEGVRTPNVEINRSQNCEPTSARSSLRELSRLGKLLGKDGVDRQNMSIHSCRIFEGASTSFVEIDLLATAQVQRDANDLPSRLIHHWLWS